VLQQQHCRQVLPTPLSSTTTTTTSHFHTTTTSQAAFSLLKTLFPSATKPLPETNPIVDMSKKIDGKTDGKADENKRKTEAEWKDQLTDAEYYVLRQKGTEPAGTGKLEKFYPTKDEGHFVCAGCANPLYSASAKFDSGCGWPAFDKCYTGSINTHVDDSLGVRTFYFF